MSWFIFNAKLFKTGTAVIEASNRGLRYGDGLFETMKLLNGKLILADEHFARLWKGLGVLQFDLPKQFTPELLTEQIITLATKNQLLHSARIRLTVVRGNGGLYDTVNHRPNYIIEALPLELDYSTLNSNGLVLGLYQTVKKSCDELSNLKHNNFLPYTLAALHAKKEKWNDALILNTYNRVCDTTIANIFCIKDNTVFTPSIPEGCIAGTMRQQLLQVLKTAGITAVQKPMELQELLDADEIFLTNSIYNLRWVQQFNNRQFGNALTQKIFALLLPTIS